LPEVLLGFMVIRVLIADDHVIVRQALMLLMEREGLLVVGEAGDGAQAIEMVAKCSPDVAVLDRLMPVLSGLEAAREIRRVSPATRIVLLTSRSDEQGVLEALQAGVKACVAKSHEARELIAAIREVAAGGTYLGTGVSNLVVKGYLGRGSSGPAALTPRERQVLQLIAEGKKTREVARLLGVSIKTAESHRGNIMEKLGIRDTAGLVRYAIRCGYSEL
jgi:two-component system, NarL family, response regulator NreC